MNIAYKHLDSRLRIAELTIPQWISVCIGVLLAVIWGMYVSPLGTYATLITSVYLGALPAAAALVAAMSEFDIWLMLRSAMRWRRMEGRFASGSGSSARGYVVNEDADADAPVRSRPRVTQLDLTSLWEEARS